MSKGYFLGRKKLATGRRQLNTGGDDLRPLPPASPRRWDCSPWCWAHSTPSTPASHVVCRKTCLRRGKQWGRLPVGGGIEPVRGENASRKGGKGQCAGKNRRWKGENYQCGGKTAGGGGNSTGAGGKSASARGIFAGAGGNLNSALKFRSVRGECVSVRATGHLCNGDYHPRRRKAPFFGRKAIRRQSGGSCRSQAAGTERFFA